MLASQKANSARLKSAVEFGQTEMGETSEMSQSVLRAMLYAVMELVSDMDSQTAYSQMERPKARLRKAPPAA